jgi:hypothetical protein
MLKPPGAPLKKGSSFWGPCHVCAVSSNGASGQ